MPTSDLLSPALSNLLLSDTFNEWLNRTNSTIDYLSPLNLYDVKAATASGITEGRPAPYPLSTGIVTLTLNHKGGQQGISANSDGLLGLDFRGMNDLGDDIANDDLVAVFDANAGVTKKVIASKLLAPEISGNHTFQNNVTISGNLTVNGTQTTLNSQDLRTEDEQIEIAFQNEVSFQLTAGPSNLTAGTLTVGQTAFYADAFADAKVNTAEAIGFVKSYSISVGDGGTAATANVVMHGPFATGGPSEFQNGGFLNVSNVGSAAGLTYTINNTPVGASGFPSDDGYLNPPGIVIKGSDSDKQILWYNSPNSFLVNTNLGVTASGAIKGAVFDSKETSLYGTLANNFIFKSDKGSNTVFSIAESMTGNVFSATLGTGGSDGTVNELTFSFGLSGPTGAKDAASFRFLGGSGASGQQLSNIPNSMFAENFNADQLDGAHGSITAGAYKIPIAGANGIINEDWLDNSNTQRTFTVVGHGLAVGEAVRIRSATGGLTSAIATTPAEAEAIGIVSAIDGNDVSVVQSGFISGLESSTKIQSITGGEVFFLSRTITGGLTTSPPSYVEGSNLVQKPMFIGFGNGSGYVLPYIGQQVQQATDELYLQGIIPVGTIYPYTGSVLPNTDFLFCNGNLKKRNDFPDLADIVGDTYSITDILFTRTDADNGSISLTGGTRGILTFASDNDLGRLILKDSGGVTAAVDVTQVNESTKVITFTRSSGTLPTSTGSVTLQSSASDNTNFFLPDLRNRSAIGIGQNDTNSLVRILGEQGGSDNSGSDGTLDPFLATNFIIRAKPGVQALVFTGHNHDDRYPRLLGGSTIATPSVAGATAFGVKVNRSTGVTFPNIQIGGAGSNGPQIYHEGNGVVGAAGDYLIGVGINDSAEQNADSFIVYSDKNTNNANPFTDGRELLHVGTDGKHYFRSDGDESGVEKYTPTTTGLEVLGNIKAITGQSIGGDRTTTLSSETTITPDFDTGNVQTFELGESKSYTLATPSNIQPGAYYTLVFVQPSSNPSAITNINSNYLFPNGVEPALTKSGDAIDMINIVCVPTSSGNKLLCNFNTALS